MTEARGPKRVLCRPDLPPSEPQSPDRRQGRGGDWQVPIPAPCAHLYPPPPSCSINSGADYYPRSQMHVRGAGCVCGSPAQEPGQAAVGSPSPCPGEEPQASLSAFISSFPSRLLSRKKKKKRWQRVILAEIAETTDAFARLPRCSPCLPPSGSVRRLGFARPADSREATGDCGRTTLGEGPWMAPGEGAMPCPSGPVLSSQNKQG